MADVLFTHSYFLRFDPKQWKLQQPYAPLGTLQAASVIRDAGFQVSFFDTMFSKSAAEIAEPLDQHQPEFFVIYDDGFNYLTKMCLTNMRNASFQMIQKAKEKNCIVIVCSSDSSDHPENYLGHGADFVVIGEGEMTIRELLLHHKSGNKNFESIPGLAFVKNGNVFKTSGRDILRQLDELPLPAWDLVNLAPYFRSWKKSSGYFSLNLSTTRGCPFKCNWCAKPIYGNRYHAHSPEYVVHHLKFLKEKFHFDHIWFCDDIFGLKPGWMKHFADLVAAEDLQFRFKIQCRVDLMLEENFVADLARSGCETVWVGAESGSQKILDAMEKGTRIEQIYEATDLMREHGIQPAFFLQFGYPGETRTDIDRTIKMVLDLLPEDIGISVSYPLPGTKFYDRVKEELKLKSNWTDSDDLSLMFSNTYHPAFYKRLHRYVHRKYRSRQVISDLKKSILEHRISFEKIKKLVRLPYYLSGSLVDAWRLKNLSRA